jgi:hypothetical protein
VGNEEAQGREVEELSGRFFSGLDPHINNGKIRKG